MKNSIVCGTVTVLFLGHLKVIVRPGDSLAAKSVSRPTPGILCEKGDFLDFYHNQFFHPLLVDLSLVAR